MDKLWGTRFVQFLTFYRQKQFLASIQVYLVAFALLCMLVAIHLCLPIAYNYLMLVRFEHVECQRTWLGTVDILLIQITGMCPSTRYAGAGGKSEGVCNLSWGKCICVCVSERQLAVIKEENIIIVHILIVSIHFQLTWKLQGMELQKVENPNLHTRV